jgi:hypothetical protein
MMESHELALCHRARGRCPHDCSFADEVTSCTMHSALSRHQAECKNLIQALKKKHLRENP